MSIFPSRKGQDQIAVMISAEDRLPTAIAEAWSHRGLVLAFLLRDIRVRYKQTVLGTGWAVLQPLLTMIVFTFVFGRLARVPSEGMPYPIFAFCGLLPWQLFARGLSRSGNCLVDERYMLTRVYVPRLIMPLSAVLSGVVDFAVGVMVLLALLFHYGITPGPTALMLLPWCLLTLVTALGAGLFLSAWNVKYRDVGHMLPFFLQLWLFVSPVAYPSSLVPVRWRFFYSLNPMAGAVEGFRHALAGSQAMHGTEIWKASLCAGLLLAMGMSCFVHMDRTFADVV